MMKMNEVNVNKCLSKKHCCKKSLSQWDVQFIEEAAGFVVSSRDCSSVMMVKVVGEGVTFFRGTAAAALPPFRPGEPALCGSCPLVTPY